MSVFMLERKYQQLNEEIAFFEAEVKKKDWKFAVKLSFVFVLGMHLVEFLWDIWIDRQTAKAWFSELNWIKLLFDFLFWTALYYFWLVKENHRQLRRKKRELQKLLQQNPSLKETVT